MSFHTQHAMEDNNEACVLHFIKTGFRIPGTRLLFDLRTAGVDMDLVKNVTHTTASWVEYAELAVHTDAQLDVPACTFSFCGRPHTLSELEAILVTADELVSLPGIWRHEPVQLRKMLSVLTVVSDEIYIWRDTVYPSVGSMSYHITTKMETPVRLHATYMASPMRHASYELHLECR